MSAAILETGAWKYQATACVEPLAARGDLRLTLAPADPPLPPRVRRSTPADDAPPGIAEGARIELDDRLALLHPIAGAREDIRHDADRFNLERNDRLGADLSRRGNGEDEISLPHLFAHDRKRKG